MPRIRLVLLALGAALLTCPVQAQMMGPGNSMGGVPGFFANAVTRGPGMLTAPRDMSAVARSWLDALHGELAITPQQEGAWLAFANAVLDQADGMQAFRTQMGQVAAATALQRATLLEQFMDERRQDAAAMLQAMSTLYDALTAQQRALLDARFAGACISGGLFGN